MLVLFCFAVTITGNVQNMKNVQMAKVLYFVYLMRLHILSKIFTLCILCGATLKLNFEWVALFPL